MSRTEIRTTDLSAFFFAIRESRHRARRAPLGFYIAILPFRWPFQRGITHVGKRGPYHTGVDAIVHRHA